MKILIVSQYFWPENFRINDLALELFKRGHEVTVLTGVPNYPDGKIYQNYKVNKKNYQFYNGIKIVRVPIVPRGKSNFFLILNYISYAINASLLGILKLWDIKFDIIFVYEPSPITVGIPSSILRLVKRAPVIIWVQDLWPESLEAIGVIRSKTALKIVGAFVKFIYSNCDLVLAQSRSFIPAIIKYLDPLKKIYYFPNWAELIYCERNPPDISEIKRRPNCFNIMFAGTIGDAQDFPSILDAADILKMNSRIHWTIVGDGRMADWVSGEVSSRGLSDSITLLGRHPLEKMPSFFKCADALLICLKDEEIFSKTIPVKLQSYLAFGKPILAMLNGEGAKIIEDSQSGLVCGAGESRSLASLVSIMSTMCKEDLDQMGLNGIKKFNQEFNREILIHQLEQYIEECFAIPRKNAQK